MSTERSEVNMIFLGLTIHYVYLLTIWHLYIVHKTVLPEIVFKVFFIYVVTTILSREASLKRAYHEMLWKIADFIIALLFCTGALGDLLKFYEKHKQIHA